MPVLKQLHESLDHDPAKPEFRSFALYGTPGVGKTSVALMYAHHRIQEGVQVVLWINSETSADVEKSFTEIAVKTLRLPGAEENGDANQNRNRVITWLQQCRRFPVLVFKISN
jgi:DNA replication protein DnaC